MLAKEGQELKTIFVRKSLKRSHFVEDLARKVRLTRCDGVCVIKLGLVQHTLEARRMLPKWCKKHKDLKSTLGVLNKLTAQKKGDLRPAYTVLCAELPKTEAALAERRSSDAPGR
jgi:hypothetical protein